MLATGILSLLSLFACGGEEKSPEGTDTGGETASTDTADTAMEERTDYGGFAGTIGFTTQYNGATLCDADITLTGTSFTGACEDCAFAFAIDAEVTRDESVDGCSYPLTYTFLPDATRVDPALVFWESYQGYANVAAVGYGYVYEGYTYAGPYFAFFAYDGGERQVSVSGNDVSWDISFESSGLSTMAFTTCEGVDLAMSDATTSFGGPMVADGDALCDAMSFDRWSFEVLEEGTVSFSVDATDPAATLDLLASLSTAEGCPIVFADDNFACTAPPPNYACPSWEGTLAPGVYILNVAQSDYDTTECITGVSGHYRVTVGGAATNLLLGVDNLPSVLTTHAVGSGTIRPPSR
jgi:hypothetical protein